MRVEAEVGPDEVETPRHAGRAQLARNLRVPGFRAGKAPPPVVIKRVGREAVLDEAVRESLGGWYRAAIDDAARRPGRRAGRSTSASCPSEGEPLHFSIEIGVRPKADARRLQGPRGRAGASPTSSDEAIGEELERLRERSAKLETVDRPAAARRLRGDGLRGHARRRAVRRRRGPRPDDRARLRPARARLRGAARGRVGGEERTVTVTFPDDYGAAELAGQRGRVRRHRPRGQGQAAPGARRRAGRRGRASTRSTSCARTSARGWPRPRRADRGRVPRGGARRRRRRRRRSRCPTRWSRRASRELWDSMLHSLSHQGISTATTYLRISGRTEEETIEQAKPDAEQALRARGGAGRDRRGRGARADRGGDARGGRARRRLRASARRRRSCWSGCASNGRLDASRTTSSQRKALDLRGGVGQAGRGRRAAGILTRRVHNLADRPGSGPSSGAVASLRPSGAATGRSADLKDSSDRSETKRGP